MKLDYLDVIASKDLNAFFQDHVKDAFREGDSNATKATRVEKKTGKRPRFTTVNPQYAERLTQLANDLKRYLDDVTLIRPYLHLILGPPGAGKSFLIESLIDYLGSSDTRKTGPVIFQQANLSELIEPQELHRLYINIKNNTGNDLRTITLLDEFDIKWSGGSAIKYLINPIYDGKFWNGYEFQKFGKCAFFFAGSYLQDRETLLKTQKLLAGVNLNDFLFDLYFELRKRNDLQGMKEIRDVQLFSYMHQKWRAEVDPQTDTIFYLSNLEKIKDFLSRVAGNVFQILDVSWPLHSTVDEFVIQQEREVEPSARVKLGEVMTYITHRISAEETDPATGSRNKMIRYDANQSPLLEYKNMILCERLLRVIDLLKKRFAERFKKDDIIKQDGGVLMDRKLLNFLTVVPLINGMRSLEQLVTKLEPPNIGKINRQRFELTEISMIIYEAEKFGDPVEVWAQMRSRNPKLVTLMQGRKEDDDYIFIPLPSAE